MVRRRLTTKDYILSKSAAVICRAVKTFGGNVRRWCAMAKKHAYTLDNVDLSPSGSMHRLCSACSMQPNAKTNSSSWMHRRRSFTMIDGESEQKLNIGALTKCLLRVAANTLSSESASPVKSRAG
ncbi:unnamed protein product [Sphagnum balticum]